MNFAEWIAFNLPIAFVLGIFTAMVYAVYCSTQCDCVESRDWNEDSDYYIPLTEEERAALERAKA